MIEYKTERVDPAREDYVIKRNSTFGWSLVNAQEIYNESTELAGINVKEYGAFMQGYTGQPGKIDVKTVKKVTNYTTMRFARDTQMPGYEKLKQLEASYETYSNVRMPNKPIKRTVITIIGILIIFISIILAIADGTQAEVWEILVCVIFPIVFIPLTIVGWVKYRKRVAGYEEMCGLADKTWNEAYKIVNGKNG